jgi:hypothetical protein
MNARAKLSPTAFMAAREAALTAMVYAKIRFRASSMKP